MGIIIFFITLNISTSKYFDVSKRQRCTGDRRTPNTEKKYVVIATGTKEITPASTNDKAIGIVTAKPA
jgi:hypothetical protein